MAHDLTGKVFLITGATEGIGKAAALEFCKRGAQVVLVGRSKEKSERVVTELKSQSQSDKIDLLLGDLSSLAEVRAVAAAFRAKYDRLDVLVNNAGALFTDYTLSADGFEKTFALNHLSYFLLNAFPHSARRICRRCRFACRSMFPAKPAKAVAPHRMRWRSARPSAPCLGSACVA